MEVSEEQLTALRIVIDMLDAEMQESPNRELADVSNYLENIYQNNK